VLLVFAAHCQLPSLAGPEHSRTIPLADIRVHKPIDLKGRRRVRLCEADVG
jgi:hypothetical protein